jgi:hypothetical protein
VTFEFGRVERALTKSSSSTGPWMYGRMAPHPWRTWLRTTPDEQEYACDQAALRRLLLAPEQGLDLRLPAFDRKSGDPGCLRELVPAAVVSPDLQMHADGTGRRLRGNLLHVAPGGLLEERLLESAEHADVLVPCPSKQQIVSS